jgi:DNA invertase Pin-like site-specific DNA recombinase
MMIGYARVSTQDQNLDLQHDALAKAGVERVFDEKVSGAAEERPKLAAALDALRPGDTLVVYKLDRLGRTVRGLVELVDGLSKRGIDFRSVSDAIDTSTPAGRFFFHVMAALAQMERELIRERVQAGVDAAKARGRQGGRPSVVNAKKLERAQKLVAAGSSITEAAETIGVSRATLYRRLTA